MGTTLSCRLVAGWGKDNTAALVVSRVIWFSVGCLSLLCGLVGALLPLLPTTPFLLLAAYAFSRSSPRLQTWILTHPHFGPPVNDWRAEGAISRRAKVMAVVVMAASLAISVAIGIGGAILSIQAVVLTCSAAFALSRPSPTRPLQ